jgi:hypothetical protein
MDQNRFATKSSSTVPLVTKSGSAEGVTKLVEEE